MAPAQSWLADQSAKRRRGRGNPTPSLDVTRTVHRSLFRYSARAIASRAWRSLGGSTCYCAKPLDDWLPWLLSQSDFFAFTRPAYDRPLASWFLASQPNGTIISIFDNEIAAYIRNLTAPPRAYVWLHYLFEVTLLRHRVLRRAWRQVPSLSATPIHLAQELLIGKRSPDARDLQVLRVLPLHKLTYKKGITKEDAAELLSRFTQQPVEKPQ